MEINNKPAKFTNLDQNQVRRQLELLGYIRGDNFFVRFFYPSDKQEFMQADVTHEVVK